VVVNPPPTPAPVITTTTVEPPPAPPVTIAPAPPPVAAALEPAPPPRVAAKPAIGNAAECAPKNEDYPPAALRAEATGTTKVRLTIDAQGKLVSSEVIKSAGPSREHRALDRLVLQKMGDCKFKAGADENGKPVGGAWFDYEFVWKINQ
jgi:periplasmic protein TonB